MVMVSRPLAGSWKRGMQPVAVGVEMRLRAVAEDLERRQQRAFGFDRRGASDDAPIVQLKLGVHGSRPLTAERSLERFGRQFHWACRSVRITQHDRAVRGGTQ